MVVANLSPQTKNRLFCMVINNTYTVSLQTSIGKVKSMALEKVKSIYVIMKNTKEALVLSLGLSVGLLCIRAEPAQTKIVHRGS